MTLLIIIMVLFIGISVFFSFRAEKLKRIVMTLQRDNKLTMKESKAMQDSMAIIASRHEEFIKMRFVNMKDIAEKTANHDLTKQLDLIAPLINNYSVIFRECLKGKGRLKPISQKCFDNHDAQAFKKFVAWMVTSDPALKRYWSSNNLNGFLYLVNLLLTNADNMLLNQVDKSTVI